MNHFAAGHFRAHHFAARHLEALSASDGLGDIDLSVKRKYVKRGKYYHLFNDDREADAWLDAESKANEVLEQAQKTSRRARKRLREKIYKLGSVEPISTVDVDFLSQLAGRYSVSVDFPELLQKQDFKQIMQVAEMLRLLQDEEDAEILLLL